MGDLCYYCDGTGERDFLSGAPCHECGGTGWRDDPPDEDCDYGSCERCGVDLYGPSPEELCDNCLWYVEQVIAKENA